MTPTKPTTPSVLSIAGSDSGGGAGIQADLHTFRAFGLHGCTAITAVTAQNTRTVAAWEAVSPSLIDAQINAVLDDFDMAAIKIGMLGGAEQASQVARSLATHPKRPEHVVLDPVLISTTGVALAKQDLLEAMLTHLLPLCSLLTPNWDEAIAIADHLGFDAATKQSPEPLAEALRTALNIDVLLKGGHREGGVVTDWLCAESGLQRFEHPRRDINAHGTGCTLSSAIAAELALGKSLQQACASGIAYIQQGLANHHQPGSSALSLLHRPCKLRPCKQ